MTRIRIKAITPLARNVSQYDLEKPQGYTFTPGQATDVAVSKEGWRDKERPFTFTSLPGDEELQFTIKTYPDHDGVTLKLSRLLIGDELEIGDPWGTIEYKGKGVFIAGGAGMTPFLAILRDLRKSNELSGNTLFFANRREEDIFNAKELESMIGLDVHHILSEEHKADFMHGRIDKDFLKDHLSDFDQRFYVCGPPEMVKDVSQALEALGAKADGIVFEE